MENSTDTVNLSLRAECLERYMCNFIETLNAIEIGAQLAFCENGPFSIARLIKLCLQCDKSKLRRNRLTDKWHMVANQNQNICINNRTT